MGQGTATTSSCRALRAGGEMNATPARRLGLLGLTLAVVLVPATAPPRLLPSPAVPFTFQVACDLQNTDVADVSGTRYWRPGDPNSINAGWRRALGDALGDMRSHAAGATDLVICGDVPEGHWGIDRLHTGIFGPVDTVAHRLSAVRTAGARIYSSNIARLRSFGYRTPFAAVGDHEVGDNPWDDSSWYSRFKRLHLTTWKDTWARYYTASGTRFADHPVGSSFDRYAYATLLSPQVLLVSVDELMRTSSRVVQRLGDRELGWLDATLTRAQAAGVPWVVVEGHFPVLLPVRARGSSRLRYAGGAGSAFWQTLRRHHVDLYLAGEMHDTTATVPGGGAPVQLVSGGRMYAGQWDYVTATVQGDRMTLVDRYFPNATVSRAHGYLWQTDRYRLVPAVVDYSQPSRVRGSMTLAPDGTVTNRTGDMTPYQP